MEALFVVLMAAVVLLTGYLSVVVLYTMFRTDTAPDNRDNVAGKS